jgi:hypothetical protein
MRLAEKLDWQGLTFAPTCIDICMLATTTAVSSAPYFPIFGAESKAVFGSSIYSMFLQTQHSILAGMWRLKKSIILALL